MESLIWAYMRVFWFKTHHITILDKLHRQNSICSLTNKIIILMKRRAWSLEEFRKKIMVTCSVDFSNKDMDISLFVFKPTVVIVDHLVHGLKQFSLNTETLGCIQSSIFKSIHGNMVWSSFLSLIFNFIFLFSSTCLCSLVYVLSFPSETKTTKLPTWLSRPLGLFSSG